MRPPCRRRANQLAALLGGLLLTLVSGASAEFEPAGGYDSRLQDRLLLPGETAARLEGDRDVSSEDLSRAADRLGRLEDDLAAASSALESLRAAVRELESRVDRDRDGVPTVTDACPYTRRYRRVDAEGCSSAQRARRGRVLSR